MITIYSTTQCPRCHKVANFLSKKNIEYKKVVIDDDQDAREELIMANIFSVPALKLSDGKIVSLKNFIDASMNIDEKKLGDLVGA